jgi:hypothetical protein
MPAPRRKHYGYTPAPIDSARAKAMAITFLLNARTLEHVTGAEIAHRYRLKVPTAETLLAAERVRRG